MDFSKLILWDKYDSIKAMLKNIMFFKERQIGIHIFLINFRGRDTLTYNQKVKISYLTFYRLSYERFNKDDVVIEYGKFLFWFLGLQLQRLNKINYRWWRWKVLHYFIRKRSNIHSRGKRFNFIFGSQYNAKI